MENPTQNKKSKVFPIIGGLVLILLIIVLAVFAGTKIGKAPTGIQTEDPLIESEGAETGIPPLEISEDLPVEVQEILQEATTQAPGASLVTKDDKVVNEQGVEVKNDAAPISAEAPRLTPPIKESDLSSSAIKLKASSEGFSPQEFTVKSGTSVTISLTSEGVDSRLVFKDEGLRALEIPVPAGYTMAKTFNAPAAGSYEFYQDIPGRSGETGVMIVK